jgi:oligopeptide transport system substrate-binding protein
MSACVATPSRRDVILAAATSTAFAGGCSRSQRRAGWLNYLLGMEPLSLDPAKCAGGSEVSIMAAIYEPLIRLHPETMAPMAGLATNYKVKRGGTRYTFDLRGHQSPEGIRLPGVESLPFEFNRGRAGGRRDVPARWSDGAPITAGDLVASWRHYLAPETGNVVAYVLYCVAGAAQFNAGKAPAEQLAVRALDAFTCQIDLHTPAPYFPMLCASYLTLPLPRHAMEAAKARGREESWVEPGHIATSGPFRLVESHPRERTVVARNWNYFDAAVVGLNGITFSTAEGATALNLFRTGDVDSMEGIALPFQLAARMTKARGYHGLAASASHGWRFNTLRPPFQNVLLRYALNMATGKQQITQLTGSGQRPAKARVPPMQGYRSPESMPVEINGRVCDVLAFDPRAASEIWNACGGPGLDPLDLHCLARTDSLLVAEVLQSQWRTHLGVESRILPLEIAVYFDAILGASDWSGMADDPYISNYPDPNDLLTFYTANYPHWSDPEFDRMEAAASATADPALRMERLSESEARLLKGMPFIPLYFDSWTYLERPEVRGLRLNPLDVPSLKYVWIDRNRKAA